MQLIFLVLDLSVELEIRTGSGRAKPWDQLQLPATPTENATADKEKEANPRCIPRIETSIQHRFAFHWPDSSGICPKDLHGCDLPFKHAEAARCIHTDVASGSPSNRDE